jgi:hypothetical protein
VADHVGKDIWQTTSAKDVWQTTSSRTQVVRSEILLQVYSQPLIIVQWKDSVSLKSLNPKVPKGKVPTAAATEANKEMIWLQRFMEELGNK